MKEDKAIRGKNPETDIDDYSLKGFGSAPRGYPTRSVPDKYSWTPFRNSSAKRREIFIEHCLRNPSPKSFKGHYYELLRIARNQRPVHEGILLSALRYIDERRDCSDFVMLGIIRLLYQLREHQLCSKRVLSASVKTVLAFKYWPDEPGIDDMCSWTENHQIMFAANEYLAGQLFADLIFSNSGMTGHEKMKRSRPRINRWLELRFKTGFSEWLSHIYYDEDITALVNLIDFCNDAVIRRGAEIVLDLIFFDMALNSFHGIFGSTHGRSYADEKRHASLESTTDTQKLIFGMGIFSGADNMSAASLALSERYRLPRVLYEIARDYKREEFINRQRMGIRIDEAKRWGLTYRDLESGMVFLSLEAYAHPKTFSLVMKMFDTYNWWENRFFTMFKKMKRFIRFLRITGFSHLITRLFKKDITRNTREEINTYTYKTPDYMLSSAQDYRKGYGGDQQHIWQATLSPEAVCFTTHPRDIESSDAWVGSGSLPRVAQIENLLIAVYRISRMPGIYMSNKLFFTHAWLPTDQFDEIVEHRGWVFGRKGNGYLALFSQQTYRWRKENGRACTVVADGRRNIWICEMGRRAVAGDFKKFIGNIAGAKLTIMGDHVIYHSPSQGKVEFGWRGHLLKNGRRIPLGGYSRYDNPYTQAAFPSDEIVIRQGKHSLRLNLERGIREASSSV